MCSLAPSVPSLYLSLCPQSPTRRTRSWPSWPLLGSAAVCQVFILTPSVLWKLLCCTLTALLASRALWPSRAVVRPLQPIPTQQRPHTPYQVQGAHSALTSHTLLCIIRQPAHLLGSVCLDDCHTSSHLSLYTLLTHLSSLLHNSYLNSPPPFSCLYILYSVFFFPGFKFLDVSVSLQSRLDQWIQVNL